MDWQVYIERNPAVMLGKPVFRGTRLTVEHVLERLGEGWPQEDLIAPYPRLTPDHLRAARAFAAKSLAADEAVFLGESA